MRLFSKITKRAYSIYRNTIVCEKLPMLTQISRKEWKSKGAIGLVYMLHHISKKNPEGIPTNEDMKVSPEFLDKIILKYKNEGFNFVSLDELNKIISSKDNTKQPFVAFTIDDGYIDNYTQALPVFERHHVPFAIFVATDFIDKKAILWWDILEDLVLQNKEIYFNNHVFLCKSFKEKWDSFRIIREEILKFDQIHLLDNLHKSFSRYNINWFEPIQNKAMSWEHIKELGIHPLCTIGGHTVTHPPLNKLSEYDFHQEVEIGISRLKELTGKEICHFAYPYGSSKEIGDREYHLIKEFNFKTMFISYGGCITQINKANVTHLPRVILREQPLF